MTLHKYKPTSPGSRFRVTTGRDGLHKGAPYRPLARGKSTSGGRGAGGRITVRHIGGGHKRRYREIDFKRDKDGIQCRVERIEYDPNRSANIALLLYVDGERRYIIAPEKVSPGDVLMSGRDAPIQRGNALLLKDIPVGTTVHCVEMKPKKGAQIARAAGASLQYVAREGNYAMLRLVSGEMRRIALDCRATIGVVSNNEHNLIKLGKAGAKRWRGVRPTVRGVAMNPVDHPHGGGEGKSSGGRHPVSPWGVPTKGFRTRRNKSTDQYIVRRRSNRR